MLIRDRIFNKLEELNMTQKEFSKRTGIAESTISDWRKRHTNPTAEKVTNHHFKWWFGAPYKGNCLSALKGRSHKPVTGYPWKGLIVPFP